MNSKPFRPFARPLMFDVVFSRFAAAFARAETEPQKPVSGILEANACKLCGG